MFSVYDTISIVNQLILEAYVYGKGYQIGDILLYRCSGLPSALSQHEDCVCMFPPGVFRAWLNIHPDAISPNRWIEGVDDYKVAHVLLFHEVTRSLKKDVGFRRWFTTVSNRQ